MTAPCASRTVPAMRPGKICAIRPVAANKTTVAHAIRRKRLHGIVPPCGCRYPWFWCATLHLVDLHVKRIVGGIQLVHQCLPIIYRHKECIILYMRATMGENGMTTGQTSHESPTDLAKKSMKAKTVMVKAKQQGGSSYRVLNSRNNKIAVSEGSNGTLSQRVYHA